MDARDKNPRHIAYYEGLVRKTAARIEPIVEEEFDDICQFLRIKVWKAIEAFDRSRVKTHSKYTPEQQLERFVHGCVVNASKDVLKKKRHNVAFIEDEAPIADPYFNESRPNGGMRDRFEKKYLSVDNPYAMVEEGVLPFVPSTLTETERKVLFLLVLDFKPAEIAGEIGVRQKDVWALTKEIRGKMADWNPAVTPDCIPIAA